METNFAIGLSTINIDTFIEAWYNPIVLRKSF